MFLNSPIPVSYQIRVSMAPEVLGVGQEQKTDLPVGGDRFYTTEFKAGQVVVFDLTADAFDSTLTLFDSQGETVQSNDDRGLELSSRITHFSRKDSHYFLRVSSKDHGGGGVFALAARERSVKELKPGVPNQGVLVPGGMDIWNFNAVAGKAFFLSVASGVFDTEVQVFDPTGVELIRDDNSGIGTDSLAAVKVEQDGTFTVWISSRSGSGAYTLRLLE